MDTPKTETADEQFAASKCSVALAQADYGLALEEYRRTRTSRAHKEAFDALRALETAMRAEKRQNASISDRP